METYLVRPDKLQEKALKAFLSALEVPYEVQNKSSLPAHVLSGIKKGQVDVESGKMLSLNEFKLKIGAV